MALACAAPLLAQTADPGSIWSFPTTPDQPQTSDGTAQLDMLPIDKERLLIDAKLKALAEQNLMTARINDISSYSNDTVMGLSAILSESDDPCTQAVRAAVYLDGHLAEADWTEVGKGYLDRPATLLLETVLIFVTPDVPGQLSDVTSNMWALSKSLNVVSKVLNGYDAYKNAQQHYAETPLIRDGVAANEIVQQAARGNWTEADLNRKRQSMAEEMLALQIRISDGLNKVDTRYEEAAQIAQHELEREIARLSGNSPDTPMNSLLNLNDYPAATQAYDNKIAAAGSLRAQEHQQVVALSYQRMRAAQFATEKALAQVDALARYSAPLARGDCSKIRRDGPIPKPATKPDTISEVLKLPDDKLMIFLKSIGLTPSADLMNCVCRSAGYGSSGTSQYYHPGTIGTYDKRYSCQQPGPPCIVAGFGCSRYPLPSDKDIWTNCGKSAGQDIPAAISQAVKARQQQD
jgi:hypothetical protein